MLYSQWLNLLRPSSSFIVAGLGVFGVACASGEPIDVSTTSNSGGSDGGGGVGGDGTGGMEVTTTGGGPTGGGPTGGVGPGGMGGGGSPTCGNGEIDPDEDCDGNVLGASSCADLVGMGSIGQVACNPNCAYDISGCSAPPSCGNGSIDGAEDCDGMDVAGTTCADLLGAGSVGTVSCTPGCTFNSAACTPPPTCGDGIKNAAEACDMGDLGGATCASALGNPQATGPLSCAANCSFNTSACVSCGDGVVGGTEQCDGLNLNGATCASVLGGGASGSLACNGTCTFNTSNCAVCGDGILQVGEQCDDGNATINDGCESCTVVCVGNEVKFGLNCYLDVYSSDTTWANAAATCSQVPEGHLVTLENASENNFVYFTVMSPLDTGARWIGLNDQAVENNFVWVTGEPLSYTNWGSGEPNNSSNEDCVEFYYTPNDWNDEGCSTSQAFVCEYEPPVQFP